MTLFSRPAQAKRDRSRPVNTSRTSIGPALSSTGVPMSVFQSKSPRHPWAWRLLWAAIVSAAALPQPARAAEPLRIGYSDWPGWVAWQVAIDKGWIKEAGLDVRFEWSEYSASMDAFAAGKLDADMVTNGDALVMGANGAPSVMILLTDYSNGNDAILAGPDIMSVADLKGKAVGVEIGLVEHLLLEDALRKAKVDPAEVRLVDGKTNAMPALLSSGTVKAVGAWQPVVGQVMSANPGSHSIYTSAQQPGLIYDAIAVAPQSLATRRADWTKLVALWSRVVSYIGSPETQADAIKIMSARAGVTSAAYTEFLNGTRFLSLADCRKAMVNRPGFGSVYGSTQNANSFNLMNGTYKQSQDINHYIDTSVVSSLFGKPN